MLIAFEFLALYSIGVALGTFTQVLFRQQGPSRTTAGLPIDVPIVLEQCEEICSEITFLLIKCSNNDADTALRCICQNVIIEKGPYCLECLEEVSYSETYIQILDFGTSLCDEFQGQKNALTYTHWSAAQQVLTDAGSGTQSRDFTSATTALTPDTTDFLSSANRGDEVWSYWTLLALSLLYIGKMNV